MIDPKPDLSLSTILINVEYHKIVASNLYNEYLIETLKAEEMIQSFNTNGSK